VDQKSKIVKYHTCSNESGKNCRGMVLLTVKSIAKIVGVLGLLYRTWGLRRYAGKGEGRTLGSTCLAFSFCRYIPHG